MTGDTIDGYLGDEAYPSNFHRQFSPQWIDAMLRHRSIAPPRGGQARSPFALLDLGCGDGLGLVALAAAHPEGRFVGIDALPDHVGRGIAVAERLGLDNVEFRCALFADVEDPADPAFDYVTAQGVLAWVSPANRAHLRRIVAAQLRPGGVACIGYNCMPGWAGALAFQQVVWMLAEEKQGTALQRYEAAFAQIRALADAGTPAFGSNFMDWVDNLRATVPAAYFPHEYLNRHWQPLWSSQVHEDMAAHGLGFAGTSRNEMLRPDFVLRKAQREALAAIAGEAAREVTMDVMLGQSFRIDLFMKHPQPLADAHAARLDGWWAALKPEAGAAYEVKTHAGMLRFDNAAAHALLAALADGPMRVADIAARGFDGTGADLLNGIDALWLSGQVHPCDPPGGGIPAGAFNAMLRTQGGTGAIPPVQVGRHGAMPVDRPTVTDPTTGGADAKAAMKRLALA